MVFIVNEETSKDTVRFVYRTGERSLRALMRGIRRFIRWRHRRRREKDHEVKHGKQKVKDLIGQGRGLTKVELEGEDGKAFQKLCKKYGVDYAIVKDKSTDPPMYNIFLKANDESSLNLMYQDYVKNRLKKREKEGPGILEQLRKIKEKIKNMPHKEHHHRKEHAR